MTKRTTLSRPRQDSWRSVSPPRPQLLWAGRGHFFPHRKCLTLVGALLALGLLILLPAQAQAAIITWDGGGADATCGGGADATCGGGADATCGGAAGSGNNWSCAANWVGDIAPGIADVATFDATSVKNATINAAISVTGINIVSTYTGTITQAGDMAGSSGEASRGVLRETR